MGGWFNHEILCLGRLCPGPVMPLNLDTSSFYHEWFLKCNEWIHEFGVGTVRWWFLLNIEGARKSFINNWMCMHVICRRPKLNICVTSDIVGGHGSLSGTSRSSNTGILGYCPDGSKHHIRQRQNKHRRPAEADKRSFSNFICKTERQCENLPVGESGNIYQELVGKMMLPWVSEGIFQGKGHFDSLRV